jgi:hypothetical protein
MSTSASPFEDDFLDNLIEMKDFLGNFGLFCLYLLCITVNYLEDFYDTPLIGNNGFEAIESRQLTRLVLYVVFSCDVLPCYLAS